MVRAPVRLQIADIGEEQSGGGGKVGGRVTMAWWSFSHYLTLRILVRKTASC